jgi:type II secretory pathway pseudopilin PulG
MGKLGNLNLRMQQSGYSLIEVMLAGVLLSFIALAILPAMMSLNDSLKIHSFKAQCNSIVRAKVQEYVNGVSATGAKDALPTASTYISSGFEYSKRRYYDQSNQSETVGGLPNFYCQVNPSAGHPGFRERITTNKVINYLSGDDPTIPADIPDRLRGFQLFVNVRHFNPRVLPGAHPQRQCPQAPTPAVTPNDYQFFRVGDAIEVVVTGMMRTAPTIAQGGRGGNFGPYADLNANTPNPRLVCSTSEIIYPPRVPFRYYLGSDGKIRNYQATLAFVAGAPASSLEAMEAHFRSLWSQVPNTTGTINSGVYPNIRSFAVSPENNAVYVLRPGELKKYSTCSDATRTMKNLAAADVVMEGVPDCDLSGTVNTWTVPNNIENITVDFDPAGIADKVYGLFNTGGNSAGEVSLITLAGTTGTPTASTFTIPPNKPRIKGVFLQPTFPPLVGSLPSLYFFDNTCSANIASGTAEEDHCVSIFDSADTMMGRASRELPVQVESISF